MQYIIDGYNLLHQTKFDSRDQMIEALARFCHSCNKTAKIVFDGLANPEFVSTRVQVVYAGDADNEIIRLIETSVTPSFYTLVTSDRELQLVAKQKKINTIKAEDFDFTIPEKQKNDDKPLCFMSDDDIERQLKEFNYFKTKE